MHISKLGLGLSAVYLIYLMNPLRYALLDPGDSPYDILGSRFGLYVATLPGSLLADHIQNLFLTADYVGRSRAELAVLAVSALVNIALLYFIGMCLAKLYHKAVPWCPKFLKERLKH